MQSLRLTGMRAFGVIWLGQMLSLTGTSLLRFAVGIWLYEQTGLATTFTTMLFFSSLPRILLSPLAGALVDRFNRKLMMMLSDLASALITLAIFALARADGLEIWHLYLLGALSSAFESFQFPAYSSSISLMVNKDQYARASGMLTLADDASRVLAPILAAVLLAPLGLEGIVLIDLISFGAAISALLLVPIPQPAPSATGRAAGRGLFKEMGFGFRYIWQTPGLLGLQANFFVVNVMLGMSTVLRTPLVLARTGNDELALGIVASVMAAGGVAGGLVMSLWGGPKRRIDGVLGGIILISLARAVLGLGREVIVWSVGGFLVLFFIAIANASTQAIWQAKTPADVQGRVFAARRLTGQLSFPLAVLISGPLADRVFEPAMAAGGSLSGLFGGLVGVGPGAGISLLILLTAVVGICFPIASYANPALRDVESRLPDADHVTATAGASD